jgi:hypothetical protein
MKTLPKSLIIASAFIFMLSAVAAPAPRHPLSQITPVDTDLDMEDYAINNLSELRLNDGSGNTGLVLDDYTIRDEGGAQELTLDYQNDEWDIQNSNLNLNGNNIIGVSDLNFDSSGGSLSLSNSDINDVNSIDGGGDAVRFDDSINLTGNPLQNADWSGADDLDSSGNVVSFDQANDLDIDGNINDFSAASDLDSNGNIQSGSIGQTELDTSDVDNRYVEEGGDTMSGRLTINQGTEGLRIDRSGGENSIAGTGQSWVGYGGGSNGVLLGYYGSPEVRIGSGSGTTEVKIRGDLDMDAYSGGFILPVGTDAY